jgi:mRNA interferase RelE/StbE
MLYEIDISEKLEKVLNKIPKRDKERVLAKIDSLAANPRPTDCKKLQGNRRPPLYRVRSGIYRIIYTIQDELLIVLVLDLGHRKEIYREK